MTRRCIGAAALGLALVAASCGGGGAIDAFSPKWQSDGGKSIAAVQARLGNVTVPSNGGVAVGVTKDGLVGVGLDGSGRWSFKGQVDARPAIASNVVVATGGGSLFALDAASGRELWRIPSEGKSLRGAGDDGKTTVVSLGERGGGGSSFLAVSRGGQVTRKLTPDAEIGAPAVAGGIAFIPWGNQYVSAIELASGDEIGRLLTRTTVSRAKEIGGSLYFGESALVRFDEKISKAAQNQASTVELARRELPGKPRWFRPGVEVLPNQPSALDRIRLYARPADQGGTLGVDSERFVATYFRLAVGLASSDGNLRWVRAFPKDIIGGDAAKGGFALCDVDGNVWIADARAGGDAGKASLGAPVTACAVDGGSFTVKPGKDPGPLAEQIGRAIEIKNTDMITIQRFLLRELGTKDDAAITKILVDLASDARTPEALVGDTRKLLASRRTGAEHMLEALGRHYDFLADILRPPPVGPMADALAAMNDKRAAPLLAAHLNDPADTSDDVKRAAKALVGLATPEEIDDIRTFFTLYRATADDDDIIAAVISSARTLIKIGGADEIDLVRHAAKDPLTQPSVKQGIVNLVPKGG